MVVGEPSLMGGEYGDEDERQISRLENSQFDPSIPAGHHPGMGPPPHMMPPHMRMMMQQPQHMPPHMMAHPPQHMQQGIDTIVNISYIFIGMYGPPGGPRNEMLGQQHPGMPPHMMWPGGPPPNQTGPGTPAM